MSTRSARLNLTIPLDLDIQIEKICDLNGFRKTVFVRDAVHEKVKRSEEKLEDKNYEGLKEDIRELKNLMMLLVELQNKERSKYAA